MSAFEPYLQALTGQDVPFSQEAEEAVLGAVLINPATFIKVASFLKPNDFYFLRHAYIWQALVAINNRNDPIDYLTVVQEISDGGWLNEIGGAPFITHLVTNTPTSVHAEVYGHIVERMAIRRNLVSVSDRVRQYALDMELTTEDIINRSQTDFLQAAMRTTARRGAFLEAGISAFLDDLDKAANNPNHVAGIPTGYTALDDLLGGLDKQDFMILAGRPGMGKSALLICIALNMAKAGFKVGLYPNEMSRDEVVRRMVAVESKVNSQRLRRGNQLSSQEWKRIYDTTGQVHKLPIYIDDTILTPNDLRISGKYLQSIGKLDILLFDGIYAASADSGTTRPYEVASQIGLSLKHLSRELNIPVLATHQVNRQCEDRKDKRPMLSDLRDSGKLEEYADQVWFLYRDCVYDHTTEFPNGAEVIVAKNRDGATGMINLYFERSLTAFHDPKIQQVNLNTLDELKAKARAEVKADE